MTSSPFIFRRLFSSTAPTYKRAIKIPKHWARPPPPPPKPRAPPPPTAPSSSSAPSPALVARTRSTPLAVLSRRSKYEHTPLTVTPAGISDASAEGLSPSEWARYQRRKRLGRLLRQDGTEPTPSEWLAQLHKRRSRVRGISEGKEIAEGVPAVVGKRIYLPNIILKFVRNHTPEGMPYNPYEATFHVPPSLTKLDIRAYLKAVYGVECSYIRTTNIHVYRRENARYLRRLAKQPFPFQKAYKPRGGYKRANVGLVEPFYFPEEMKDMSRQDRVQRERYLDTNAGRKRIKLRKGRRFTEDEHEAKQDLGWIMERYVTPAGEKVLKAVEKRRKERLEALQASMKKMVDARVPSQRPEA